MRKCIAALPVAFLLTCSASPLRADTCNGFTNNLVSNCGFESGSFSSWGGSATTVSSNYVGVDTGDPFTSVTTPYSGNYEAYLGNPSATVALTQTLATSAGSYLIEFALLNDTSAASPYTNSFSLLFGGSTLFSESAVVAGGYTLYSFLGSTTSTSTPLSFVSENDGGYFELDSVSVTAAAAPVVTPEPSSWLLLGTGVLGVAGRVRRSWLA